MASNSNSIPEYPFVSPDDLTIDDVYLDLQKEGPIKAQLAYGEPIWICTRYEDVKTVYGDRRFGKSMGYGRDTPRMHEYNHGGDSTLLANMDPPDHTRVRRLASAAFSPAQIRSMAEWIETMTNQLLDEIAAHGHGADYMAMFAWKLPLRVITGILGVEESFIPTFKGWVDEMTSVDSSMEQRLQARENMMAHLAELVAQRREAATDDLLSVLVRARDEDDRLSEEELISLSMTLFLGGFETTAAQLGSTVWTLMAHRHLWDELLAEPDMMPTALEELWRWVPSFRHGKTMIRWANEDVELSGGFVIPKGEAVLPEHQVANRDESVFENGAALDFHRSDPAPHLSLGWGPHRCMGAHLANLEVETALTALLERFPSLGLSVAAEDVKWSPSTFLRSPAELPLNW